MTKGIITFYRTLLVIYICTVFFLCFFNIKTPGISLDICFLGIQLDKYAHFLMFLPYTPLIWINLKALGSKIDKKLMITLSSGIGLAALTEIAQSLFFASRQGDFFDFLADTAAILTGILFICLVRILPFEFLSHWKEGQGTAPKEK